MGCQPWSWTVWLAARDFDVDGASVDVRNATFLVVDMDSIPGYKGVPDAPLLLARYLYDAAERAVEGRRPSSGSRRDSGHFH